MDRLIAVVSGGTRGIGLGVAEALLKRGAAVAVTYNRDARAAKQAKELLLQSAGHEADILVLQGDVAYEQVVADQHEAVRKTFGSVNVLVNNAGIMPPRSLEDLSRETWDETLRVNLSSAYSWSRAVVPGMKAEKFGRIVNIASLAARGGGVVGPHYAASKAGLLGLTRYAARELGPFGITVNAINPAFIQDAGIFAEWSKEREGLKDKIVVPELGRVRDVVRAFEYLLDSPFVTGVALDVCGGAFMI
ncbi:MAG: SDR family oxidoreductase [Desulfohalobiaceae bacterium]|nr:SDR family oxidoreductase [Desulfohalobiaceae bacterium]